MSVEAGSRAGRALFPLGQSLGQRDGGLVFDVRVGDELRQVDPVQWAVWALAHGLPGVSGPWTADDVLLQATAAGLPDAREVLTGLADDGLVVEAPADAAGALALAERVRVMVALLPLGNSAEEPAAWSLGLPGQPLVHVDEAVYEVVVLGHLDTDLWTTVQQVAAAPRPSADDVRDPVVLLGRVLDALPTLLSVGAVHLDRAVPRTAAA
ncbi:hypothetical protein [Blastococcus sp. TF02A-26]|uniref:hypothetical protein n=1 Tax=Blastococcus sp. TF02A-26 TaxID=2250577 RepID=UPI0011BE3884|nr:hypothetical protein [Blastococcus sp. TF02A-26]